MNFVCNYAVARFLPYSLTGEFANIGVVLCCQDVGYLDFRLTTRVRRVTDFFPELSADLFREVIRVFKKDATTTHRQFWEDDTPLIIPSLGDEAAHAFTELVRPRESLIRFGPVSTVSAAEPAAKLDELFQFYIERQFAQPREYQENLMKQHFQKLFVRSGVAANYKPANLGDESYSVPFPFVRVKDNAPLRAIKPLDLAKENSTRIFEHGDQWLQRITRLRRIGRLPEAVLFPVRLPSDPGKCLEAAQEIVTSLRGLHAEVVPETNEASVLAFARAA